MELNAQLIPCDAIFFKTPLPKPLALMNRNALRPFKVLRPPLTDVYRALEAILRCEFRDIVDYVIKEPFTVPDVIERVQPYLESCGKLFEKDFENDSLEWLNRFDQQPFAKSLLCLVFFPPQMDVFFDLNSHTTHFANLNVLKRLVVCALLGHEVARTELRAAVSYLSSTFDLEGPISSFCTNDVYTSNSTFLHGWLEFASGRREAAVQLWSDAACSDFRCALASGMYGDDAEQCEGMLKKAAWFLGRESIPDPQSRVCPTYLLALGSFECHCPNTVYKLRRPDTAHVRNAVLWKALSVYVADVQSSKHVRDVAVDAFKEGIPDSLSLVAQHLKASCSRLSDIGTKNAIFAVRMDILTQGATAFDVDCLYVMLVELGNVDRWLADCHCLVRKFVLSLAGRDEEDSTHDDVRAFLHVLETVIMTVTPF